MNEHINKALLFVPATKWKKGAIEASSDQGPFKCREMLHGYITMCTAKAGALNAILQH